MDTSETFENFLNQIIEKFSKAEKNHKEDSDKYKNWIDELTNPENNLIQNLLNCFLDEMTKQESKENILKIFKKLLYLKPEIVGKQLTSNPDFPKAIFNYISSGCQEKMSDNSFYLITKLYNDDSFKPYVNQDFIEAMFNGLSIVKEEDILIDIVAVLVEINSKYLEGVTNLVLKTHKSNNNARVLDELLLRLFNNETVKEKEYKILLLLNNLMDSEDNQLFYASDLESFIDIILYKLEMTYTEEFKIFLLHSLERATKYNSYMQSKFKDEEIFELMSEFQQKEDEPEEIKKLSGKIIENIVKVKESTD